jgi:hypothetical protein
MSVHGDSFSRHDEMDLEPIDITVQGEVEIRIRADRTVVWVSDHRGTVLRMCRISNLTIVEEGKGPLTELEVQNGC